MSEESNIEIKGKWILLLDEHIISSGNDIENMFKEAEKKHHRKNLVLAKVPTEGNNIY